MAPSDDGEDETTRRRHRHRHSSRSSGKKRSRHGRHHHRQRSTHRREERETDNVKEQASHIAKVLQETGRVVGYDDEENPFGDTNLSQAFVWHKKIEKQLNEGVDTQAFSAEEVKEKHDNRLREIEQVKKRRLERDRELAQRQEEMDVLQRERLQAEAEELEQREEGFHSEQARTRSEIRLESGRAKPVDIFYNLLNDVSSSQSSLRDPCKVLESLNVRELQELQQELRSHADLDGDEDADKSKYWKAASTLCSQALLDKENGERASIQQRGVHRSLESDMMDLLKGKSMKELELLEKDIATKLECGNTGDEEYWGAVLKKISVHVARDLVLEKYDAKMRALSEAEALRKQDEERKHQEGVGLHTSTERNQVRGHQRDEGTSSRGQEREDLRLLEEQEEGDKLFKDEVEVVSKVQWWHETYQARKPRYKNHVHTGFEWTKYNQTHYDYDNPPPKVVRGYKFNIYYPDLIDQSKAPSYKLEQDPESLDHTTCILRFNAGAPYEDLAFRIVNKEWEYTSKKGFKCNFDRGVLRLYFNFKRSRYRK